MTIEHSLVTDPNIHEPKGASSAQAGQTYVSNGNGSGAWTHDPQGWQLSIHGGASQGVSTSDQILQIDGANVNSILNRLPKEIQGTGFLWSSAQNKILPVALGDFYTCELYMPFSSAVGVNQLNLKLDKGNTTTPTNVFLEKSFDISFGSTVHFTFLLGVDANMKNNGVQLFLSTDAGTVNITSPQLLISRVSRG